MVERVKSITLAYLLRSLIMYVILVIIAPIGGTITPILVTNPFKKPLRWL